MVRFRLSAEIGSERSCVASFTKTCAALGLAFLASSALPTAAGQTPAPGAPGPAVVVSGLNLPSAIASDSQGNLYVVDEGCAIPAGQGDCNVYKETLSGGAYTQSRVAAFTAANLPTSIAVDAGGNVYLGVRGKGILKEAPSGPTYTESAIGCAFSKPAALALDGRENFFVFDSETGRIYREKAGDTCATATVVAGLTNVTGIAVDSCGRVYAAQSTGATSIVRETPVVGGYAQSPVGSGMAGLIGVGVDAHGDVYYADVIGSVNVLVPNGQDYTPQTVMKGLSVSPIGPMAFDAANNFYYAEFPNSRIWKVAPSFPPPTPPACGAAPTPSAGQPAPTQPH